jgi:hypothetical protein
MSFRVEIPAYVAAGQGGSIKRGRKSYAYSGGAVIVATRVEADDIAAHMPDGLVTISPSAAAASTITNTTQHIRAFQPNPAIVAASEPDSILETKPGQLSGQYV